MVQLTKESVHDFIIRIFCVSAVRFWITLDHLASEILNEGLIKGAPAVLSTMNEDAQFNADVHEVPEALL